MELFVVILEDVEEIDYFGIVDVGVALLDEIVAGRLVVGSCANFSRMASKRLRSLPASTRVKRKRSLRQRAGVLRGAGAAKSALSE